MVSIFSCLPIRNSFPGFQCKAIVVVPNDGEFKRRVQAREAIEGKEVPDAAVLNMKANFVLPEVEENFFNAVYYTELSPLETLAIVTQYNAEAISNGQSPTSAVTSFKSRNERQRAKMGLMLPGEMIDQSEVSIVSTNQNEAEDEYFEEEKPKVEQVDEGKTKEEAVKDEKAEDEIMIICDASGSKESDKKKSVKRRSRSTDSFGRVKRSRSKSSERSQKKRRSKSRSRERRRLSLIHI